MSDQFTGMETMKKLSKRKLFQDDNAAISVYISNAWLKHLELMNHLCQFSQNIILITAPEMGGKTTLFKQFQKTTADQIKLIGVQAKEHSNLEELMQCIAKAFDGEVNEDSAAFRLAQAAIQDSLETHATVVLAIDDAHLLSDEQLHALFALVNFDSDKKQLRLVFFGNPSLELRLFSQTFSQVVNGKIYTIELEPWSTHDVRSFIGKQQSFLRFTNDQISEMYERSQGIPGYVVREFEALEEQKHMGKKMQKRQFTNLKKNPMVLGALIGIIAGGAFLVVNQSSQEEDSFAQIPVNMDKNEVATNEPNVTAPVTPTMTYHAPNVDHSDRAEDEHFDMQHKADNVQDKQTVVAQTSEAQSTPATTETTQAAAAPVAEKPAVQEQAQAAVAPQTPVTEAVTTTAQAETPAQPEQAAEVVAEKAVTEAEKPVAIKAALSEKEQTLLSRSDKAYTIQLLGARNEQSVKQFVGKQEMANKATYFRTKLSGKDWFVVVYGDYPSADAAKAAADDIAQLLPNDTVKPWVRQMNSVQQDINKYSQG